MGSPVSAVEANLYVEFFEELALESAAARPRLWKRYVQWGIQGGSGVPWNPLFAQLSSRNVCSVRKFGLDEQEMLS